MTDPPSEPEFDEGLEAWLDGLKDNPPHPESGDRRGRAQNWDSERLLQDRIDAALRRCFRPPGLPPRLDLPEDVAETAAGPEHPRTVNAMRDPRQGGFQSRVESVFQNKSSEPVGRKAPSRDRRRLLAAVLCLAAGVLWMVVWRSAVIPDGDEPYFQPTPLVAIYRTTVADGFRPYYECHDMQRFEATFRQRQGQPLRLKELPSVQAMLGLSYLGGLSRETTAMLCKVNDAPVMVFVDRVENDRPEAIDTGLDGSLDSHHADPHSPHASTPDLEPPLHVFRREYKGLVIYEVTPWDRPTMRDALIVP